MSDAENDQNGPCCRSTKGATTPLRGDDAQFYGALRRWITARRIGCQALKRGDAAPEFLLPDDQGRLVSSRRLLTEGPVVLSFFGGSWCPHSITRLRAVAAAISDTRTPHVTHYALTPETGSDMRRTKKAFGLETPLLADLDSGVGLLFGVIFVVPRSIRDALRARGVFLEQLQGVTTPMLSVPATFVIARSGLIWSTQIEEDYACAVDVGPLVAAVRAAVAVPPGLEGCTRSSGSA